MNIDKNNIVFTFYLDGNKYVVFSLEDELSFNDDLYFAKEIDDFGNYDAITGEEYEKVLNEYKEYLQFLEGGEENEN